MIEIKGAKTIVFGYELVMIYNMYQEVNKFSNLKIIVFDIEKDLSKEIIYENCEFIFMPIYDKEESVKTFNFNFNIENLVNLTFIDTRNSFFDEIFQKYNFYNLSARQKIIFLNFLINNVLSSSYLIEYIPNEFNIYNQTNNEYILTFNILKKKLADTQMNFDIDDVVLNIYNDKVIINNQELFKNINNKV